MKLALIFLILIAASDNNFGQNLGDDDLNCRAQAWQHVASEVDSGTMLAKNNCVAKNSFSPLANRWDHQNNETQDRKFTITCSDSWLTRDKSHHFLSSAFLSAAAYYFFREEQKFSDQRSLVGGFCFSLSMGLAKELRDGLKKNNAFSVKDLAANLFGIAVGLLIISD